VFERRKKEQEQGEFWVRASELPKATPSRFYELVDRTLNKMEFAARVWALCRSAYAEEAKGGRPGIDPVVYLKMLMVGFFEDLPSERAIASRCADSLSVRAFLGYDLTEATPEHSSLTVIRQRLGLEIYQRVFELILVALREHGLLKGRHLGIDSSVLEANASLQSLVERNTEEDYWTYVKRLAGQAEVDPKDIDGLRRFDRNRPKRKTSNQQWLNPHDREAKIGKTKRGVTAFIYKPEHVVDLDSGAIVVAEILPGDQGDTTGLKQRMVEARKTLRRTMPKVAAKKLMQSVVADKGYFALEEIKSIQELGTKTVINDKWEKTRPYKRLSMEDRQALRRAKQARESKQGRALLGQRGPYLERSFFHILDHGGLRWTSLRGRTNLTKRYKLGAAFYNLSQLMRKLYGIGTTRQWIAASKNDLAAFFALLKSLLLKTGHSADHCLLRVS